MIPTEAFKSSEPLTTPIDSVHDAEVLAACERLSREFPTVPPKRIEALMSVRLSRTLNSSIETFRVVLAERSTRARLYAEGDHRKG
jgi:hypothetical protein